MGRWVGGLVGWLVGIKVRNQLAETRGLGPYLAHSSIAKFEALDQFLIPVRM